jgi:transcriptional regulator with XRE-family HTH domain
LPAQTAYLQMPNKKKFNRIKVVLIEKDKSNLWLAEKMGMTPAAVSRWCTNDAQPSLETLFKIAKYLGVEVTELINVKG